MIGNSIRFSQRKVIRNFLTLKVTPRLGSRNLRPSIVEATIERSVGRNPVVGTGAETLTLIVVLLSSKVVQPVREEVVSLGGNASEVPITCQEVMSFCFLICTTTACHAGSKESPLTGTKPICRQG